MLLVSGSVNSSSVNSSSVNSASGSDERLSWLSLSASASFGSERAISVFSSLVSSSVATKLDFGSESSNVISAGGSATSSFFWSSSSCAFSCESKICSNGDSSFGGSGRFSSIFSGRGSSAIKVSFSMIVGSSAMVAFSSSIFSSSSSIFSFPSLIKSLRISFC